jgi:hypothetical protein
MAGIEHNFDEFAIALDKAPARFENEVLDEIAGFISDTFGRIATQRYMQEGPTTFSNKKPRRPPTKPGPLRKVSQRLARAVRGQFSDGSRESTTQISVGSHGLVWTRIIAVPYARIHEKGGTIRVPTTPKMESFFWHKYFETANVDRQHKLDVARGNKWRRLAIAAKSTSHFNIDIPARPYAGPALQDTRDLLMKEGQKILNEFVNDVLGK